MSNTLFFTLHGTWLSLESNNDTFLAYIQEQLSAWLSPKVESPDIEIQLHWGRELIPAHVTLGSYRRLGRRLLMGDDEIIQPEFVNLPGLQLHTTLARTGLSIEAAFRVPSGIRSRLLPMFMSKPNQERIYATLVYYLIYFPLLWHIERTRQWYPLHASAVSWPQGAVILTGLGGVGKSTLTLAFLSDSSAHLLSENLILHDENLVYAFPEPIHLDNRSRKLLNHLNGRLKPTGQAYSHSRQSYEVPQSVRVQSAKPRIFCMLRQGQELGLRLVPPQKALEIILSSDMLAREVNEYAQQAAALNLLLPKTGRLQQRIEVLHKLLKKVNCYELTIRPGESLERATALVQGRLGW